MAVNNCFLLFTASLFFSTTKKTVFFVVTKIRKTKELQKGCVNKSDSRLSCNNRPALFLHRSQSVPGSHWRMFVFFAADLRRSLRCNWSNYPSRSRSGMSDQKKNKNWCV